MSWNNLRSKNNRAIRAWLLNQRCGGVGDILTENNSSSLSFPLTIVHSTIARPNPAHTGDYRITTHIIIRGSASQDDSELNKAQARINFDNRIAVTFDALMQTDDQQTLHYTATQISAFGRLLATPVDGSAAAIQLAANNADMVDYTCQAWYDLGFGDGQPDQAGCDWEEILIFDSVCCASNTD